MPRSTGVSRIQHKQDSHDIHQQTQGGVNLSLVSYRYSSITSPKSLLSFSQRNELYKLLHEYSLSQPQPDQPQSGHFYYVCFTFDVCFSCVVSLNKAIINYCYWQSDWILFHSRNIHISYFAEAEPENLRDVWLSLSQNIYVYVFFNKTILSQIASSNS